MLTNIYKSLNERARALGIATDLPYINRSERRRNLKLAIKEEKQNKNPIVKSSIRKFIGTK
jgi:hypothetical protein